MAGYDRTSYNGHDPSARPGVPVGDVAGVFSGFTASDLTASVGDVARLGYDLFGKAAPHLAPPDLVAAHMVPGPYIHYAFATFNLTTHGLSGADEEGPYYHAYGHLGATYGYDSLLAYFPGADVSLAVASDIETDTQVQPADTMCFAYAAVLADLTQTEEPSCTYTAGSYHGGKCECVSGRQEAAVREESGELKIRRQHGGLALLVFANKVEDLTKKLTACFTTLSWFVIQKRVGFHKLTATRKASESWFAA